MVTNLSRATPKGGNAAGCKVASPYDPKELYVFYWKIKEFDTYEQLEDWIAKNRKKYQYEQIFINNKIAVQYRDLLKL